MQLFAHCRRLPEEFTVPTAAKARCLLDGKAPHRLISLHIAVFVCLDVLSEQDEVESGNMACVSEYISAVVFVIVMNRFSSCL